MIDLKDVERLFFKTGYRKRNTMNSDISLLYKITENSKKIIMVIDNEREAVVNKKSILHLTEQVPGVLNIDSYDEILYVIIQKKENWKISGKNVVVIINDMNKMRIKKREKNINQAFKKECLLLDSLYVRNDAIMVKDYSFFPKYGYDTIIFTYLFIILNVLVYVRIGSAGIEQYGINRTLVVNDKEYYRLFTYMFLHTDIMHIAVNMVSLFFIGTVLEKKIGYIQLIVVYLSGGMFGALTSISVSKNEAITVGSSAAVYSLLGALTIAMVADSYRKINTGIKKLMLDSVFLASSFLIAENDSWTHVGGYVMGLVVMSLLFLSEETKKKENYIKALEVMRELEI